jgi:hypothetical protein
MELSPREQSNNGMRRTHASAFLLRTLNGRSPLMRGALEPVAIPGEAIPRFRGTILIFVDRGSWGGRSFTWGAYFRSCGIRDIHTTSLSVASVKRHREEISVAAPE